MIQFKDFAQKIIVLPGWFTDPKLEPVEDTIRRMNNWMEEKEVSPINIETLVLPFDGDGNYASIFTVRFSDTSKVQCSTVYRVWYDTSSN